MRNIRPVQCTGRMFLIDAHGACTLQGKVPNPPGSRNDTAKVRVSIFVDKYTKYSCRKRKNKNKSYEIYKMNIAKNTK